MNVLRRLPFVFVLAYFVFMIRPGLTTLFSPDDMMNIHVYWSQPWWKVAKAIALVVTPSYRPMGGAFYLPIYHTFGLHPLPFRVVIFCLLCLNCWLLYCLGRRLTGSRLGGSLTAVAGSYHAGALGVYLSTAVIYDVLCYAFLAGALLYYVRIRQSGRTLNWREILLLLMLYAGAIDSKEMGVVLPGVLVAYELLYRPRGLPQWAELMPILLCGLLAGAFVFSVVYAPADFRKIDAYKPILTAHQFMLTTRTYAAMLFFRDDMLRERTVEFLWALLFAAGALLRRRDMIFGAAFSLLAYLPLNFVTVREGYALYIPLIGFSLWFGGLLTVFLQRLNVQVRSIVAAALLVAVTGIFFRIHYPRSREQEEFLRSAQQQSNDVIAAMHRLHPRVERNARLLFVDNPWGEGWDMYFIAKLYFNDRTAQVAMTWPGKDTPYGDAHTNFNHVFRWVNGGMIQEK